MGLKGCLGCRIGSGRVPPGGAEAPRPRGCYVSFMPTQSTPSGHRSLRLFPGPTRCGQGCPRPASGRRTSQGEPGAARGLAPIAVNSSPRAAPQVFLVAHEPFADTPARTGQRGGTISPCVSPAPRSRGAGAVGAEPGLQVPRAGSGSPRITWPPWHPEGPPRIPGRSPQVLEEAWSPCPLAVRLREPLGPAAPPWPTRRRGPRPPETRCGRRRKPRER